MASLFKAFWPDNRNSPFLWPLVMAKAEKMQYGVLLL